MDTDTYKVADYLEVLDHLAQQRGVPLESNVPLAPMTTLRVGGLADRMASPRSVAELRAVALLAEDAFVPADVIGKGSDIVVADAGIRGLVIRNRATGISLDGTVVQAESGAAMATLVKRCTEAGLGGLEFGISIPGTVGGAVWANAGAHDGQMADVVEAVDVWGSGDKVRTLTPTECLFDYRESRFKASGDLILGATLVLRREEPEIIAARVAANHAQRVATQPLADQNAGSVFRNPPGDHAGRLIDAAGLKGLRVGGAMVSQLHANFIVTDRDAKAADVRRVGDRVRAEVFARFGVELAYEIEFVGDWPGEVAE